MADSSIVGFLVVGIMSSVANALRCGGVECFGFNSYCCLDDDLGDMCCFYSVYDYWWFWFVWILFLCFIGSCAFWCCRRRRASEGYYVIRNDVPQSYGTTWTPPTGTPSYASPPPTYPATQFQTPSATAPPYPPPPTEKPPAYAP